MPKTTEANPFGLATESTPAVNAQELTARLAKLQQAVQAADRERATAEARHEQAKKDLAAIDEQLKALNVDPATAEEALKQLELELATLVAQFEEQVATERKGYAEILAATQ